MLEIYLFKQYLLVSIVLSTITCSFIQKTKFVFKHSKNIPLYSFLINLIIGIIFCNKFTYIGFPSSLWIGFLSFLGADTIYKNLEGKLSSHSDMIKSMK